MNAPQSPGPQPTGLVASGDEFKLTDLLFVVIKRKKLIIGLPIVFAICAALSGLFAPEIYRATTTVLPSQQNQSSAAAMLNQLGGFAGTTPGALSIRIPVELYLSMLKSSTVADNLINRFDLKGAYGTNSREQARELLRRNSFITHGRDGLIVIAVKDTDPKRAAQLANAYPEELLKLANRMALTEASHRRLFFQRRLQSVKDVLVEAELLRKHRANSPSAGARDRRLQESAEAAARLRAQITAKAIQLEAMQAFVTTDNKKYGEAHEDIGAMRADLERLENTHPEVKRAREKNDGRVAPDSIKTEHDVKYYEILHELLTTQYEAARIDEAKDSSIIEVMDPAFEPERSMKPKQGFTVLIAALLGVFVAVLWVFLIDVIQIGRRLERVRQLEKVKR
jgi:tyrosine-protein kinase Etk/Wzc